MKRVVQAGAVLLPAAPGWYHGVNTVMDLVDFVVARVLDQLGVEHELSKRWSKDSIAASH
jgi:4-hydroxy-3-polyprenylbenzoate decarboxylase